MTCGFDLGCHLWGVVSPFWFWIQVGFWLIVAALALWGLSKVKDIAGWPGVAAVAGLGVYLLGYIRGRRGESVNPLENLDPDSPDAQPSASRRKPRVRARTAKRSPSVKPPGGPPPGLTQ